MLFEYTGFFEMIGHFCENIRAFYKRRFSAGHEDEIYVFLNVRRQHPERFPDHAARTRTADGVSDLFARRNSHSHFSVLLVADVGNQGFSDKIFTPFIQLLKNPVFFDCLIILPKVPAFPRPSENE